MAHEVQGESAQQRQDPAIVRRYKRYAIDVGLQIHYTKDGAASSLRGRGSDIGAGGMSAFIPAGLEVGQTINLTLTLPYCSEQLRLNAVVRNRSGFRYGLEFFSPSEREREVIERCCTALSLVQ
jgi:c-di-GMP-binding flagellar brake protein YcgR